VFFIGTAGPQLKTKISCSIRLAASPGSGFPHLSHTELPEKTEKTTFIFLTLVTLRALVRRSTILLADGGRA
jgi:hypothetical protein